MLSAQDVIRTALRIRLHEVKLFVLDTINFFKETLGLSNKHEAEDREVTVLTIGSSKFASEANFANAVFDTLVSFRNVKFASEANFAMLFLMLL